eukprot:12414333-Karenia_brevis.AAC.1
MESKLRKQLQIQGDVRKGGVDELMEAIAHLADLAVGAEPEQAEVAKSFLGTVEAGLDAVTQAMSFRY